MADLTTAERLRRHGLRVTPQRRAILTVLDGLEREHEHVTADEVYARARAELPELSRATVYNALHELAGAGLVAELDGPGSRLYDATVTPHEHFRCRSCGRVYDVDVGRPDVAGLERRGFAVERAQVVLEGICPACRATARTRTARSRR